MLTVYHICNIRAYHSLLDRGYLSGDGRRSDRYFSKKMKDHFDWCPYDWMADQMLSFIGKRPKHALKYPVWVWYKYNNKNRPDLRTHDIKMYIKKGEEGVLLKLQIPKEKVLLSNFDTWHNVLNYYPITNSEIDDKWWDERRIKLKNGIMFHKYMIHNFKHIFNLKQPDIKNKWSYVDINYIQGTVWIITKDMVMDVTKFKGINKGM